MHITKGLICHLIGVCALILGYSVPGWSSIITINFEGEFTTYGSGTVNGSISYDSEIDYSSFPTSGGFPSVDISTSDGTFRNYDTGGIVGDPISVSGHSYDTGYDLPGTVDQFDLIVWLSSDFSDYSLVGERFLSITDIGGGGLSPDGGTATVFEAICQNSVCGVEFPFVGRQGSVIYSFSGSDTAVPEPATLAIFGLGLVGLGYTRRIRNS